MKTLLLSLLLVATPLFAQTNTQPINVVVIVLTSTNQMTMVLNAISNQYPSALFYLPNPKVSVLETQIKLMEQRVKEQYEGVPNTYVALSSEASSNMIDHLETIWKQKEKDEAEIQAKKEELKKLYNNQ